MILFRFCVVILTFRAVLLQQVFLQVTTSASNQAIALIRL
jgi:hypothetical protein